MNGHGRFYGIVAVATLVMNALFCLAPNVWAQGNDFLPNADGLDSSRHLAQQAENIRRLPEQEEHLLTRAEFASILVRSFQLVDPSPGLTPAFSDLDEPVHEEIDIVVSNRLMDGYPDGKFRPEQFVTKLEALTILVRAANITIPTGNESEWKANLPDDISNAIPAWALPSVVAAMQSGIYPLEGEALNLEGLATRGMVASMINTIRRQVMTEEENAAVSAVIEVPTEGPPVRTALDGLVMWIPEKTILLGYLAAPLRIDSNQVGNTVQVVMTESVQTEAGSVLIPAGSQVMGEVIRQVGIEGPLDESDTEIYFQRIITPSGRTIAIDAQIINLSQLLAAGYWELLPSLEGEILTVPEGQPLQLQLRQPVVLVQDDDE